MRRSLCVFGILIGLGPLLMGGGQSGSPAAGETAPVIAAADSTAMQNRAPAEDQDAGDKDPLTRSARIAHRTKQHTPLRILVVGAHPADVFDQSGGTMAHHIQRGDWVGCAVLTHGARVHDKVVADDMFRRKEIPESAELKKIMVDRADVKSKEVIKACSILGVKEEDVFFLGADDAVLLPNDAIIRQVARLIRKLHPNVIITHFPREDGGVGNQHATTGQIVMHAIGLAAAVDPGDKTPPCQIAQAEKGGQACLAGHDPVLLMDRPSGSTTETRVST